MPSGVDAQSWIGFEHRIQERRFKALVDAINGAISRGDGIAARLALEEARELRPTAAELKALSARVALLPTGANVSTSGRPSWYRSLGAVAMFVVGIGLVIGIESLRPEEAATIGSAVTSTPAVVQGVPGPVMATPFAGDAVAVSTPAPSLPADVPVAKAVKAPAAPVEPVEPKGEEPVGTAGVSRASVADARPAVAPNRQTFRETVEPEPVLPASREVPIDDVAASPRSEGRPGYAEVTPSGPAIAANVMPQPVSITAMPPAPLPAVATVASTVAAPRGDNTRVAQVLNQYARAYGQLDPTAARAVWPTVDERALTRAFASLASQDVSFDKCDIDVKGNLASASCSGTASYVGKVGSRQSRTEARQWNFELKLHGDDWKIEKAEARQLAYR